MDTPAVLGFGQVHMCRYLMLCVCGTMIAMITHTASGIPVRRKILPTPRWPSKPASPAFEHRKVLRPGKHEYLWMGGPSGDGPTENWESAVPSKKSSLALTSVDEYATRSPMPNDIFPSQSDPFPTVIDTDMGISETFSDELLSRVSVPFEGPSSLLNTFMFRPSIKEETSSSVAPTPTLESYSVVAQITYDLSASWTEGDELSTFYSMSSRRALSDTSSEVFAIITAISATHIYTEDSWPLSTDPSGTISNVLFDSSSFNNISLSNRIPAGESTINGIHHLSSLTSSLSVHLQSSYYYDEPYFEDYSSYSVWSGSQYSSLDSQTSFPTNVLPQNVSDSFIGSFTVSDTVPTYEYSQTLIETSFLPWSPYATSINIHTSNINSETYYFKNSTLDSSFSDSFVGLKSSATVTFTPYHTIFLSQVETTVTIIDNKETPFTFILPTLTISGTSFNDTNETFSKFIHNFSYSSSDFGKDHTDFSQFSSFKQLSSDIDTIPFQFSKTVENTNFLTTFTQSPTESHISTVLSSSPFINIETQSIPQMVGELSLSVTHSYYFLPETFSEESDVSILATTLYLSHSFPGTEFKQDVSFQMSSIITSEPGIQSISPSIKQSKSGTEPNLKSESQKKETSSEYSISSTTSVFLQSTILETNATISRFDEILPSISTSFSNFDEQNTSFIFWKSTENLKNEIIDQTYKPEKDIASSRHSFTNDIESTFDPNLNSLAEEKITHLTPSRSKSEGFDTLTHHVTARSLSDTWSFDGSEQEVSGYTTTNAITATNDIKSDLIYLPTETRQEFTSRDSTAHFQSPYTIPPISVISSISGIPETNEISEPYTVLQTSEGVILPIKPIHSERSLLSYSSISFSPSRSIEEYYLITPHIPLRISTSEEVFIPVSTTISFENIYENISGHSSDSRHVFSKSSMSDSLLTELSETTKSMNIDDVKPEEESEELGLSTLTSVNYPIIPTPALDEYPFNLSNLDNYFLESSNLSSKEVENMSNIQSSITQTIHRETDISSDLQDEILTSKQILGNVLNILTSYFELTPKMSTPSQGFQVASLGDDSYVQKASENTYFEFPDSTKISDYESRLETFVGFESSGNFQSPIYDDFETYVINGHLTSNFAVSSTPSFESYIISSFSPFNTLFHRSDIEDISFSVYSFPPIIPHSVILPEQSKIRSNVAGGINGSSMGMGSHSTLSYATVSSIQIQQPLSKTVISSEDNSIISTIIESSFHKIDALDLSAVTHEVPLSTAKSIFVSNLYSNSLLDASPTMLKEPRSIDLDHSKSKLYSSFEIPMFSQYSFSSSKTPHIETSTTTLTIDKESQSIESDLLQTKLSTYSETPALSTHGILESSRQQLVTSISIPSKQNEPKSLESEHPKPEFSSFLMTPVLSSHSTPTPRKQSLETTILSIEKYPQSIETEHHVLKESSFLLNPVLSSYSSSIKQQLETLTPSSGYEAQSIESNYPKPIHSNAFATPGSSNYYFLESTKRSSETLFSVNGKQPLSIESDIPKLNLTVLSTPVLSINANLLSTKPQFEAPSPSLKTEDTKSIDSDHPKPITSSYFPSLPLANYDASMPLTPHLTPSYSKDPQSIASDQPQFETPSPPLKTEDPKSIDSDHPKPRATGYFPSLANYDASILLTPHLTPSYSKDPQSIASDRPQFETPSPSLKTEDPKSIDSDHPKPRTSSYFPSLTLANYDASMPLTPHLIPSYSKDPQSIAPDQPQFETPSPPLKTEDPKSIDSDHPKPRATGYFPSLANYDASIPLTPHLTPSYSKDPQSIATDHPKPRISSSYRRPILSDYTSSMSMKPLFESSVSLSQGFRSSSEKISTVKTFIPVYASTDLSPTWFGDDHSDPGGKQDTLVASVLPISSFLNVNQTKNVSGDISHTIGKSQVDESSSTNGEMTVPTDETLLFKDNHYWILSVLEAPIKGHLPENFSHTMEIRFANAYSEAFRIRASKNNDTRSSKDMIVVKILSLTDDILLRQLEVVYVVERGGILVPASVASEYLSFLRFEQLREYLGHHVIVKARPYRPPDDGNGQPVGSPLPVLAIVGGVLGSLFFIFCCFCVYCRCCRPKPLPSTPESSTSGSLQRSLSKYGQHNRKHLFREMTHQLTSEMAAQMKHGSSAAEMYLPGKSAQSGRSLPTLPRDSGETEKDGRDKSMKILKILENKDASTSPIAGKQSRGKNEAVQGNDTSSSEKKKTPKPKRRRKIKDSHEQSAKNLASDPVQSSQPESPPPTPPPKGDVSIPTSESRQSSDSGTSSRNRSSQPSSPSENSITETESEGSNVELLPPIQDLVDRSKCDSEAAAAETQMHLSRVRQRIAELLDDAFAMAGGRRLYGSLRSKKIEPATNILPRYGSFRAQSAIEGEYAFTKHHRGIERRPVTEGGQRLLGVITDEGQLITRPPPKLVWEQDERYMLQEIERPISSEVVEARNINLFPFHHPRSRQIPALPSASSLPVLDTLHESQQDIAMESTVSILREAASELYLAHSTRMNPAVVDQYDEIDVISALRNGEPVEALIQAIKDELQRFSGTLPGTNDSESHA